MAVTKEDWKLIKNLLSIGEWLQDLDFSDEDLRIIAMWLYDLYWDMGYDIEKHLYTIEL